MVSNAGPSTSTCQVSVPRQRTEWLDAVRDAADGLAAAEWATTRLIEAVAGMDDAAARGTSALPDWTRGHVVTHLARNADALVNLLTWARTGVEHPMYASGADRDQDIATGAPRSAWLLREDLVAACGRFAASATGLGEAAWQAEVTHRQNRTIRAHLVPWIRTLEVWVHLIDLDLGVGFDEIPEDTAERLIDVLVSYHAGRPDTPALRLEADVADGRRAVWQLAGVGEPRLVSGPAAAVMAWMTGRGTNGLEGDPPLLPAVL